VCKFVPSGHIYKDGALTTALPLGKKGWDAFRDTLDSIRAEL